jgi:hypothetical protein
MTTSNAMHTSSIMPTPRHPLLDRLWSRYVGDVVHARSFVSLCGGAFHNDHIALRTLARPGGGIEMFARVFEHLGWRRAGHYTFPDVHLSAIHLSHAGLPRIFVSELHADRLPHDARAILDATAPDAPAPLDGLHDVDNTHAFDALAAWFARPAPPTQHALDVVGRASQYGAWLLAFGRSVNHFTASVDDVPAWQQRMRAAGVPMKADIEGAPGGPLCQTATAAAHVDVTLHDGTHVSLPYAYFEIAARTGGFDGFLAPQARQLFDMTAT